MGNSRTLQKELMAIVNTRALESQNVRRYLSRITKVLNANIGEPILFGEINDEDKRSMQRYIRFVIGIISECALGKSVDYILSYDRYCQTSLTLPVRKFAVPRSNEIGDVKLEEGQIRMKWEKFPGQYRYVDFANENEDLITIDRNASPGNFRSLEVVVGTTTIEEIFLKKYYELIDYCARMDALDLEPSDKIKQIVLNKYVARNIFQAKSEYEIRNYINILRRIGFGKFDKDYEIMPGVKVNPKRFLAQI